jgi:HisJ family histidinol phosphate phosphatase
VSKRKPIPNKAKASLKKAKAVAPPSKAAKKAAPPAKKAAPTKPSPKKALAKRPATPVKKTPLKPAASTLKKKAAPVAAKNPAAVKSKPPPLKSKKATPSKLILKTAPKPAAPIKQATAKKLPSPSKSQPAIKTAAKPAAALPSKKSGPPAAKPSPTPAPSKKPSPRTVATPSPAPVAPAVEVVAEPAPAPVPMRRTSLPAQPPGPTANGALYYDSHMHTPLCKHAWGEPEEYATQGVQSGLKGIIFTCHCPMPEGFWPTVRMADAEFDTYLDIVQRTAKAFRGKLDVRLGLESEYFPGMEPWIEKLHQRADFDYILGAVHWQARDYLAKFETGTIEAFRKTYFNHLAVSAETGLYDCLAHPDLVKNYHPDSWCLAIVKENIASALDRIAATGVAMELNTSGLNKSYSEMNPGLEMLRMMADRQIPIVIGSDAHRPHRVGEHFMTALSHLQEAGYDQVGYFLNRKRIDLKIAAVQASIKKAADAQVT